MAILAPDVVGYSCSSPLGGWLVDIQSGIAHAHFFLDRHDEATSWALTAMQNPDFQAGVRISAASNAMAGRPEEAHEAVVRLQRLNSALRVSNLEHVLGPYRRAEDLSRPVRYQAVVEDKSRTSPSL